MIVADPEGGVLQDGIYSFKINGKLVHMGNFLVSHQNLSDVANCTSTPVSEGLLETMHTSPFILKQNFSEIFYGEASRIWSISELRSQLTGAPSFPFFD